MAKLGWLALCLAVVAGCKPSNEGMFRNAANGLDDARKNAAAAGLPIDPEKYNPIDTPEDRNAAVAYRKAMKQWSGLMEKRHTFTMAVDKVSRYEATAADYETYKKSKPLYRAIVDDIRIATSREAMDRNLNYVKLNYTGDSEGDGLHSMTVLISAAAVESAKESDYPAMRDNLNSLARMAQHAGDEPRLAGVMNQVRLTRNYVRTALNCLHATGAKAAEAAQFILDTKPGRPQINFKESLRGELAANIGLVRALGTMPNDYSKRLDATGVAELIGALPDPATEDQLAIVDTVDLATARKALEARLLEAWTEFFPKLQGTPVEMIKTIEREQNGNAQKKDPTYALMRGAYCEVETLAGGVMASEAAMAALDLACMRLQGKSFGQDEEAMMKQHSLSFEQTPNGFLFRRSLDVTKKPIFEYKPKALMLTAR